MSYVRLLFSKMQSNLILDIKRLESPMRNFSVLTCFCLVLTACGATPRAGTSLIETGQNPDSGTNYRVEKYDEPTTIDGLFATHAIVTQLRRVQARVDSGVQTTYYDFAPGDQEYFNALIPSICQADGLRYRGAKSEEDLSGIRLVINIHCG